MPASWIERLRGARPCVFHAPVDDVRGGQLPLRDSAGYRAALAHVRDDNQPSERCFCPRLREPARLTRVRLGS